MSPKRAAAADRWMAALALSLLGGTAVADDVLVSDETTAGRRLIAAPLPHYPAEEIGRWTESCIAIDYAVRTDGHPDQFVLLEIGYGPHKYFSPNRADRATARNEFQRFANASLKAVVRWRFAPARAASEEIAVFRFERTEMGGHLMKVSARRLDLGTPQPTACRPLDPRHVRDIVAEARAQRRS